LKEEKQKRNIDDVAIIRIEELSPFPVVEIKKVLTLYKNVKQFVW
jgi:2-oxoglutarate dehydrogenase complex dehydrogenase (E1) component-like enzyme